MKILYKAKRLDNGEWVEGFPIKVKTCCLESMAILKYYSTQKQIREKFPDEVWCICTESISTLHSWAFAEYYIEQFKFYEVPGHEEPKMEQILYTVDPKTICIFTGLTDYYGTKIFENDIVVELAVSEDDPEKFVVPLDMPDKMGKSIGTVKYGKLSIGNYPQNIYGFTAYPYASIDEPLKVIGNIFDNQKN